MWTVAAPKKRALDSIRGARWPIAAGLAASAQHTVAIKQVLCPQLTDSTCLISCCSTCGGTNINVANGNFLAYLDIALGNQVNVTIDKLLAANFGARITRVIDPSRQCKESNNLDSTLIETCSESMREIGDERTMRRQFKSIISK